MDRRVFARHWTAAACGFLLALAPVPGALAQQAESPDEAVKNGKVSLQTRLSYDYAEVADNELDAATQLSLRTRLGYRTGTWSGLAMFIQFQDVSALVRTYAPLDPEYETINDPEAATTHQVYLEVVAIPESTMRVGRQEFRLENGRFLSESPWRQNGQSFDAVSFSNKSIPDLYWIAGYAKKQLNSAAEFVPFEHFAFVDFDYSGIEGNHFFFHAFLLDNPDDNPRSDSATYGVRAAGDFDAFEYAADYNLQQKYADATGAGGNYISAFAAVKFGDFRVGPGYTLLSGASGSDHAFDTLIGTTHQFQGFANVFSGSNGGGVVNGIEEYYLLLGWNPGAARVQITHHILNQETQDQAYGEENDARVIYTANENLILSAEVGLYTASSENESGLGMADKTVYTLRSDYRF